MTKQRQAQALTAALMAAGLGVVAFRNVKVELPSVAQPKSDPTPQDTIYAMFDAAREGKVSQYLGYYTGQMLASVQQTVSEQGEARFAAYLKETNAPVKGIAIMEPQTLTDREVKLRVEYVYQDRNEVQVFYLEKQGSDWKIARLDAAERIKTLVPYGTPVR